PVVRFVNGVDGGRVAKRGKKPAAVARNRPHDLSLPRDDAATGRLLVELTGVAVAGVEVILRAGHVPPRFAFGAGLRTARLTARAGSRRAASSAAASTAARNPRRNDPAAVLHAAVDAARPFHLELE